MYFTWRMSDCEELVGVTHTNQMRTWMNSLRTCVDFEEIRTKATAPPIKPVSIKLLQIYN